MKLIKRAAFVLAGAAFILGTAVFTACNSNVPVEDGEIEDPVDPSPTPTPTPGPIDPSDEIELDWEKLTFLGDGAKGGELNNKYKMFVQTNSDKPSPVNLQNDDNGIPSIYIEFANAESLGTSLGENNVSEKGAALFLHLTNFTKKETKFTVLNAGKKYLCYVYYADGADGLDVKGDDFSDVVEGKNPEDDIPPVDDDGNINWDGIDFIVNGTSNDLSNKYKMYAPKLNIVNIQQPSSLGANAVKEAGIYVNGNGAVIDCSLEEDFYVIDGAGILIYLSAFEKKVTEFNITNSDGALDCSVYYVDGTE